MTLSDLLVALKDNTKQFITLVDGDNALITFNAAGYASVESDITERTVDSITIVDPCNITITLV